ncbi:MAG TPA: carboxypeptidase-like regulatory domain-containing protein, partial [Candidatus Angelobacter sp.]|nr:carboxypeptidase-like regulatory domain-containing protein [Candidatus Angelobacter sp.]
MSRWRNLSLFLLAGIFIFPILATAQSTFGDISGTITDPSGAVVPGATITVTNLDTKSVHTSTTDAEGVFRVVNLDPGTYRLEVSAKGFDIAKRSDFALLARQSARLDFKLIVSAAGETVEVQALPNLNDQLTISDSKTGDQINSLALNFRATNNTSPINVANLTPGVQPDRGGNISVAGGLPYFTSFSIDGITTANVRFNGPNKDLFPSVEATSEFKVNTANN